MARRHPAGRRRLPPPGRKARAGLLRERLPGPPRGRAHGVQVLLAQAGHLEAQDVDDPVQVLAQHEIAPVDRFHELVEVAAHGREGDVGQAQLVHAVVEVVRAAVDRFADQAAVDPAGGELEGAAERRQPCQFLRVEPDVDRLGGAFVGAVLGPGQNDGPLKFRREPGGETGAGHLWATQCIAGHTDAFADATMPLTGGPHVSTPQKPAQEE